MGQGEFLRIRHEQPHAPGAVGSVWERLRGFLPTLSEVKAYLFLSPLLILFFVFLILPVIASLALAFMQWSIGGVEPNRWVGLANYVRLADDWRFWTALRVTLAYTMAMVVIPYSVALPLALLMNMKIRGRDVFRTILFLPVVTPVAAAGLVFVFLFNTEIGVVNAALIELRLVEQPVSWLGNANTAFFATIVMIVWSQAGFNAVTLLSGLQTITQDILESAALAGASGWSMFRYITLPLLRPTSAVVLSTSLVGAVRMFAEIFVMTQGGPARATATLGLYLHEVGFKYWQLGYATAISTVILVLCQIANLVSARAGRVDWR